MNYCLQHVEIWRNFMEVFVICVTAGHCSVALLTAEVINQQNIPWLYGPHDPAVSKDIAA